MLRSFLSFGGEVSGITGGNYVGPPSYPFWLWRGGGKETVSHSLAFPFSFFLFFFFSFFFLFFFFSGLRGHSLINMDWKEGKERKKKQNKIKIKFKSITFQKEGVFFSWGPMFWHRWIQLPMWWIMHILCGVVGAGSHLCMDAYIVHLWLSEVMKRKRTFFSPQIRCLPW